MTVNVAINGFGRIGRLVLRGIIESGRKDINVVAINDLGSVEANAHMLQYDSVHGRLPVKVKATKTGINVGGKSIKVIAERDPANLPWEKMGVDIALECTGLFTTQETAGKHLAAGAKRVLVSAPASGADLTVVYGVNHNKLRKSHKIVSNASCTTNCLAPVAQVLDKTCGIARGYMTTVHAFTGDQQTVDTLHSDPRRSRAASLSMIPTSTGAAKAVGLVLPQLVGKLDGTAVRVPTPNVSMIDLVFEAKKKTTVEQINAAITKAANGKLEGILGVCDEPLVSIDFNHDPHSSTFDLTQTQIVGGKLVRVLSWYDNEWGFANRMSDTAVAMGKL
ncbi:type I glyceraldehyde-3-phosphate dehydrogenase [Alphaproteobacteria bacterium]|jgi:glyceraldehyde 3-phosphate dehydrogenase|nr:type I glyceraldehyde-3-phosphate dehydrogenase [Alphaproteobacteria bacterium]MDA8780379.1 type I glyceraldehyde-3-phosphate dehydrogenase [Alphaproteobacteria bacterium]MDA9590721.1 type I glyceraldehyde-3-phosphate dehydrogenase [Alphaproteobacteria bacterium]MDB2477811.1 type I glyceraldehyde-3-phosphate dehydrogenase [Alphaproteobacteria bacterium]MDB2540950.1 type I glyceraldehyde-3-phosphate dehydrogenase [Alphaproteobacteria bacterium]